MAPITQSGNVLQAADASIALERLRTPATVQIVLCAIIVWILYVVSGFRLPTQPITLSDADAGATIRQLVFTAAGMLAGMRLVLSRTLGALFATRTWMIALAMLLVFSALWSDLPTLTIKRSIIYIFGLLALLVIVHGSRSPVHLMLRSMVYFTAAVSTISLLLYAILPAIYTVNPGRPGLAGISNHPNTLGPFLSIGLLLSIGLRPERRSEAKLLLAAKCALATGLLLTMSITTILTTIVGIAIYLFLSANNYKRGLIQLAAIAGALIVAVIGTSTLKAAFFNATGRDESLSGRDQLWAMVWIEYQKSPVTGRGFGAFWTEGKGRELVQTWNPRQSHNAYLDVLLDLGALGLLAVLLMFPVSLLLAWPGICGVAGSRLRHATAAMMAVAFSYMLVYAGGQGVFLRFDIFPFFILMWITLLITNQDRNNILSEFSNQAKP
jgi:O-antigen ligase